jgi:hypothetical protein
MAAAGVLWALLCAEAAPATAGPGRKGAKTMESQAKTMESQAIEAAASTLQRTPDRLGARPVENPFFRAWRLWRVADDFLPPRVAFVATREGQAHVLRAADGFRPLTATEPVRLSTAEEAVAYVAFHLSVTDFMTELLLAPDQVLFPRDEDRARWRGEIKPPAARREGTGWEVEAWLREDEDLVRARFRVDASGAITVQREVVAPGVALNITTE